MRHTLLLLLLVAALPFAARAADRFEADTHTLRPENAGFSEERLDDLTLPDGFTIEVFAKPGGHARMLEISPAGVVLLTRPRQGDVIAFHDGDGDGSADAQKTIASGLDGVHGIALVGDAIYLAAPTKVWKLPYDAHAIGEPQLIIDNLPDGGQHPNRTLAVHRMPGDDEGRPRLWITVGSTCNACRESNPEHATILTTDLDGGQREIFATGLRNTLGFGWHPETGEMWGMDHGSDMRGDNIPPEELNHLQQGKNYGWPYVFGKRQIDPIIDPPPDMSKADYAMGTEPSVLEYQAHSAPIGMVFYDPPADAPHAFSPEFRGDAFVAMRGSWNRKPATGYKIVRIVFDEQGHPTGFEDFVTGFLLPDGESHFARLAGIAVHPDGSLLFTDDTNGIIYRVTNPAD